MLANGGVRVSGITVLTFKSALDGREWSALILGRFGPMSFSRRPLGHQSWSGRLGAEKYLLPI